MKERFSTVSLLKSCIESQEEKVMVPEKLFIEIKDHIKDVVSKKSALGRSLWDELLKLHPADIAVFFSELPEEYFKKLFVELPQEINCAVFREFSESMQSLALSFLTDIQRSEVLSCLTTDELTDIFETLSDDDLKKYLGLLQKNDREKVLSLLQFDPQSAGGIMDTDVLPLTDTFTVHRSIQLIQRLQVHKELHRKLFVINKAKQLVGFINLEDLVLHKGDTPLSEFMKQNEFVVQAYEDQESIAQRMMHYNLAIVPVVGENNYFLGVIPSSTLVDVIGEESAEDVYRMSAMSPVKGTYLEVSFWRQLYQRSYILIVLMLAQSLSSAILKTHKTLLAGVAGGILLQFVTMLISTGGNASSQTSGVIIQGMASGEINSSNLKRFFKREILLSLAIACVLGMTAFARVYTTSGHVIGSIAVTLSVFCIVVVAIIIGSTIPVLLRRLRIDPAYWAGPVLATVMDILGLLIYCTIAAAIFSYFTNFS